MSQVAQIRPTSKKLPKDAFMHLEVEQLNKPFYTVAETAELLNKTKQTITNWCSSGKLSAIPVSYGLKMTYKIPKVVLINYLEELNNKKKHKSFKELSALNTNHKSLIDVWDKACAQGLISGRPYSMSTRKVNRYFLTKFIEKYGIVSFENLKYELLSIPTTNFGKREKMYKVVWNFSKWLVNEGLASPKMLEEMKEIKPKRHRPPKRLSLTEEQLDALENACKTIYELTLVVILSHTGLRSSEFCSLKGEDVDLQNRKIKLIGKGGKYREIGLTKRATEVLTQYLQEYPSKPRKHLFLDKNGKQLVKDGVYHRLERIAKRAGIPAHPHAMRRAFVTTNANKGRSLVTLQILCGHSDIGTTRSYCQTTIDEAVKQIQEWD